MQDSSHHSQKRCQFHSEKEKKADIILETAMHNYVRFVSWKPNTFVAYKTAFEEENNCSVECDQMYSIQQKRQR